MMYQELAIPLFTEEYGTGNELPSSSKELSIKLMDKKQAAILNEKWHSRLPEIRNWWNCIAFGAEYQNRWFAIALWGPPISASLNDRNWYELRRMAICDDAPKYTATYMLGKMIKWLQQNTKYEKLISYQDTSVHTGTIYKAGNWKKGLVSGGSAWNHTGKIRKEGPTKNAVKIRWEYDLESRRKRCH
jgi:hypothetical protein